MEELLIAGFKTILVISGAWFIANAVKFFKEESYFVFGVEIMLIFWIMLGMIKLTFFYE